MSEPKPFASLSSGLLARKGAAKPAMRPQGFGQMGAGLEDLGWNDMGATSQLPPESVSPFAEEHREHVPSSISALTPAPRTQDKLADSANEPLASDKPVVAEQQRAIAQSFSAEPEAKAAAPADAAAPSPIVSLPRRPRKAPGSKAKAAFTLRLDPDRHLKLRLACAIRHRSAQQIVSEALDKFLQALPELEAMTGQLPAKSKTN
jgi:hypothetical protein